MFNKITRSNSGNLTKQFSRRFYKSRSHKSKISSKCKNSQNPYSKAIYHKLSTVASISACTFTFLPLDSVSDLPEATRDDLLKQLLESNIQLIGQSTKIEALEQKVADASKQRIFKEYSFNVLLWPEVVDWTSNLSIEVATYLIENKDNINRYGGPITRQYVDDIINGLFKTMFNVYKTHNMWHPDKGKTKRMFSNLNNGKPLDYGLDSIGDIEKTFIAVCHSCKLALDLVNACHSKVVKLEQVENPRINDEQIENPRINSRISISSMDKKLTSDFSTEMWNDQLNGNYKMRDDLVDFFETVSILIDRDYNVK